MDAASLGKIRKLYAIEEEIKGLTAPEKKSGNRKTVSDCLMT
ncbi:hypothetical protein [Endozoicomonas acroporae]